MHPPSLQGFLHWLRRSGAEVKREAEGAGNFVRVMTVHGAKGLQAPLVILPDTTALPPDDGTILWGTDPLTKHDVPIWSPRREVRCAAAQRLRDRASRKRMEEHNRLLYVGLTRAEDHLLVCGWQTRRALDDACWYRLVERGFDALPAVLDSEVRRYALPQLDVPEGSPAARSSTPVAELPAWHAQPPPPEATHPTRLAPSRPENAELGPVPAAASPLSARDPATNRFQRGKLIHTLLQHLPDLPAAQRAGAARAWLERSAAPKPGELTAEILAILDHPELAPLFGAGSRAEVPLTGVVGNSVIGGLVDRLAVLPDRVLIADFKTNRRPPERAEDTPVLYLRQMAAYRAVLRSLFPDRPVTCALVWTQAARVAMLPDRLLESHAPNPT
jgi:ATP-dependent helicase/nuclease subunit A